MKESRLDLWQEFMAFQKLRQSINFTAKIQSMMDYCEYLLHIEFDKNSKTKKKYKKNKHELSEQYLQSYKTLSQDQKLAYYLKFMKFATQYMDKKIQSSPPQPKGVISSEVYSRSFNLKIWKHKVMRLDRQKCILYAEKDKNIKTYILQNYLIRKSKNKQFYSFVLEAVNDIPNQKLRTVHLGFKQEAQLNEWYKQLTTVFDFLMWQFVAKQIQNKPIISINQTGLMRSSERISQRSGHLKVQQKQNNLSKSLIMKGSQQNSGQEDEEEVNRLKKELKKNEQESILLTTNKEEKFYSDESSEENEIEKPKEYKKNYCQNEVNKISTGAQAKEQKVPQFEQIEQPINSSHRQQSMFRKLMPKYDLKNIQDYVNYGSLFEEGNLKVLEHLVISTKMKMVICLSEEFNQKVVMNLLTDTSLIKKLNPQVEELDLKTLIKSENSALMYLKVKAYNKLYRPRDFLFLRHVFNANGNIYIVDKSIEDLQYPPYTSIVRGQLCVIWGIIKKQNNTLLIADVMMKNEGYLNGSQNANLILNYLKGFANINKILSEQTNSLESLILFYDNWEITQRQCTGKHNLTSFVNKTPKVSSHSIQSRSSPEKENGFKKHKEQNHSLSPISRQEQVENHPQESDQNKEVEQKNEFDSNQNQRPSQNQEIEGLKISQQDTETKTVKMPQQSSKMQQQRGEIEKKEEKQIEKLMVVNEIKRNFDKQGNVIVSQSFIKTEYILRPLPKKNPQFQQEIKGHPIWKGEWIRDEKTGPILFVDQKKIQDQKGVLKFILTKIGKNIMSGKSVLNISLPVDIFCAESNLERFLFSFTYAPTILEGVNKDLNPLTRLKKVISFGMSNSPLYLNMEKPFNPILGETFQCWIDGCPGYAEQISHHPPIAALWFQGRGYRITAQLQSKVQLHMNSGCGINDGIFRVKFDDGIEVCYMTPGGEVSGLVYGDRKFNMVGKGYYWIEQEGLFVELVFNPSKKGFFSVGKQEQPIDYFEGVICKVKPQFFQNFLKKKKSLIQKDIISRLGRVHGIWNKEIFFQQESLLNIDKEYPVKLQYETNPLPSDANWREDIAYKRIQQTTKSQSEKQRLEVLQRKDRKLREANPHSSHKN